MKLFSIIIPTYNRGSFIVKTLDSVFNQSFTDYEVIVVDNCSTDNTQEILQKYIYDGSIKYIRHEENLERAVSRNTGLSYASGMYVTFLDSDDLYHPNFLEEAYKFLQAHKESKFFHTYYEIRDSDGQLINQPKYSQE